MSSFSSPSSLAIPFQFRRKSSLAFTSVSIDTHAALPSPPPPSSSPLLTPLHFSRSFEWRVGDYFDDDLDGDIWNQRDKSDDVSHSWSSHARPEHSTSHIHSLPSLITKFAPHTSWGDALLPFSPSPFSSTHQTTYSYPQGDSAIADDCEEYDLESMDIHIHETYFATSAERGRWLSSPIASRARSQAAPPMRGYSSPVKAPADTSPLAESLRKRPKSCAVDKQIATSFLEDHDADMRCLSPLPPSSPITSPLSNLSFLDDCEGDAIVDPCSNSDHCHSFGRTPELSTSSTTCTSLVECACAPTPHGALNAPASLPPIGYPCHSPGSAISCHSSPRRSRSPNTIDAHSAFDSDDILSPLSQFELDLPDGAPLKRPLSDMENRFYPGQRTASPDVSVNAVWSHNGRPSAQLNLNHTPLDVSLDIVGSTDSSKNVKKRRGNATGNPRTRRTKMRIAIRHSSDGKKRRGAENHTSNHSEPPSKKSKVSHCGDDSESCANPRPGCSRKPKVERLYRSPSRPAIERCNSEAACARDTKTSKTVSVPVHAVDTEFRASLTGMLIEAFATSRATSMDSAALYLVLTQAHPYLAVERPKQELLVDISAVLEAGRVRCGMFEKVDSSGARSRHKALESRWFYIPERDEDEERASLISAIMPRQKRTETKKYKQYYYRPLDRISRWDPEDAA